jgi:Fe-S cluster assembly protein SufD
MVGWKGKLSMSNTPEWLNTCFVRELAVPAWLRDLQTAERASFLDRGLPHRKEERWKYNDLDFLRQKTFLLPEEMTEDLTSTVNSLRLQNASTILVVLVNGKFSVQYSDLSLLSPKAIIVSLATALQTHSEVLAPRLPHNSKNHPFASLNTALLSDGVFISVPDNTQIKNPIHILHVNTGKQKFIASPRNVLLVGANSHVTVIEEHHGLDDSHYFVNMVTDIEAQANAWVDFHKIQNESQHAAHIAQLFLTLRKDAVVNMHNLAIGGHMGRDDVAVNLVERGAACHLNGFYNLTREQQQIDNHIAIEHLAPYSVSEMLYKGIADKNAKAIFNGKVTVHVDAQKIKSHQYNHNLLLSNDADDVQCAHGATVGQLDNEALFFLRARGIPLADAMKILTQGFAADVLNKIGCQAIKQKMTDLLHETFAHDN